LKVFEKKALGTILKPNRNKLKEGPDEDEKLTLGWIFRK
jgi:hypothetical protein